MASVVVSSVIDAPVARVWDAVRVVTETAASGGGVFREVLVAHSDAERSYSYTFVGSPIPVREHRTTLAFRPITDGDRTLGEWSSRFFIAADQEAELVGLMEKNFLAGLRALGERLGCSGG